MFNFKAVGFLIYDHENKDLLTITENSGMDEFEKK